MFCKKNFPHNISKMIFPGVGESTGSSFSLCPQCPFSQALPALRTRSMAFSTGPAMSMPHRCYQLSLKWGSSSLMQGLSHLSFQTFVGSFSPLDFAPFLPLGPCLLLWALVLALLRQQVWPSWPWPTFLDPLKVRVLAPLVSAICFSCQSPCHASRLSMPLRLFTIA